MLRCWLQIKEMQEAKRRKACLSIQWARANIVCTWAEQFFVLILLNGMSNPAYCAAKCEECQRAFSWEIERLGQGNQSKIYVGLFAGYLHYYICNCLRQVNCGCIGEGLDSQLEEKCAAWIPIGIEAMSEAGNVLSVAEALGDYSASCAGRVYLAQ